MMKKFLALFLALIMAFGLVACDEGGSSGAPTVVGKWKGSLDITSYMEQYMDMELDKLPALTLVFSFTADGSVEMYAEKSGVDALVEALLDVLIDMVVEQYGGKETFDAMLDAQNMTMTQFREMCREQIDTESLTGSFTGEGVYKFEDSKIYIADDAQTLEAEDYRNCYYVTLAGNMLTINDIERDGELMSDSVEGVLPLVLKRS